MPARSSRRSRMPSENTRQEPWECSQGQDLRLPSLPQWEDHIHTCRRRQRISEKRTMPSTPLLEDVLLEWSMVLQVSVGGVSGSMCCTLADWLRQFPSFAQRAFSSINPGNGWSLSRYGHAHGHLPSSRRLSAWIVRHLYALFCRRRPRCSSDSGSRGRVGLERTAR